MYIGLAPSCSLVNERGSGSPRLSASLLTFGPVRRTVMSMNYLIIWTIKEGQHAKSMNQFHSHGHNTETLISALGVKGIKVSLSLHELGEARGFIVAQVSDIAALQTAKLLLGDVYDVELVQVLTDEESARALAPLVAGKKA